ncbi:hypothetical protein FY557_11630 [Chryseobacterium sp. SN22]|uniref:hypothetical protein n=1 Tax=Chryseobacterium sp. SN22 TaxID=2606431 RepID=UPI0011EEEECA|nr:hypothetical protein [Chryseobacterium sp. SN22]KAA0127799.1 hypothetical protein FY557_11630 [Chryseobacterium sp. SN22]
MGTIPEDFTAFLYWVKDTSEKCWADDSNADDWSYKARWQGLTQGQIDETEQKYQISFAPEHRAFLRILHTLDRKEKIEYTDGFEEEAEQITQENSFFINWLEDDEEIRQKLVWPFQEVLRDVLHEEHPFWKNSWGIRPDTKEEIVKVFTEIYKQSPPLIPIYSHRFMVSDPNLKHRPVLSIWGTDTIVYGWTFRTYILNEIGPQYLGTTEPIFDEEYQEFYPEFTAEARKIREDDYKYDASKTIPFWREIILSYNTGWSSFGMQSPPNPHLESLKKSMLNPAHGNDKED